MDTSRYIGETTGTEWVYFYPFFKVQTGETDIFFAMILISVPAYKQLLKLKLILISIITSSRIHYLFKDGYEVLPIISVLILISLDMYAINLNILLVNIAMNAR